MRKLVSLVFAVCLLPAVLSCPGTASAQGPARSLVTQAVDESRIVSLHGTVHPLAQARFDQGAVPDSFPAKRILLMLNRPPEREAAFQQFLTDAHTPGSASFHKWLTPEQLGQLYGPADSDVQVASQWLASHGFSVARITKSKRFVEFSGTAAMVRDAFHTEIHQYSVNGEPHYANATELAIPEALAPLIRGVSSLTNFYSKPALQNLGATTYSRSSNPAKPAFTNPDGMLEFFAIAPEDFATQYDLGPLYSAGTNGTGQTVGILNRSNIDVSLANAYRALFNLSANPPQVVIDGDDPGIIADRIEAYLDVELSGAVAPDATVNLYIADGSGVQDPLVLAALRAIEDNQASVLSASYEECELELAGNNALWSGLWEQASAQGQTVFVGSGDSGPALCSDVLSAQGTNVSPGLTVNGLASTPWNVAVGGTDFYYSDYASGAPSAPALWNQANDANFGSLKASLPEQPWDNALGLNAIPSVSGGVASFSLPTLAGGGGPSNCSQVELTPSLMCIGGYPKPTWQNAPGVPADGARDIPDLSLLAAGGQNFSAYAICAQEGDCSNANGAEPTVLLVGGTSASSPAMAGIMALVDQKYGRQGQADFTLYALARQQPSVFHDVTVGTNDVLCITAQSPACNTSVTLGVFPLMDFGVYPAGPGYDLASGLGSVDANALVSDWTEISFLPTSTTLSLSPTSIVHGTPVTFTANVSATSGGGTPGGDVDISISSTQPLPHSGAVPVVNGTASESVNFFPGGTYQVTADYAGDGTFAPSHSSPLSLTVTPEASVVTPVVNYSSFAVLEGQILEIGANVQNGQQVPFGAAWVFEAVPSSTSNGTSGMATGTVTFTDGTTTIPALIDSAGIASVSVPSLALGQHSVSVSYSGDASFNPSSGGPLAFTVVHGIPRIILEPNIDQVISNGGPQPFPVGTNLTIGVLIGSGHGVAPSGNISVTLGSTTQTVSLAPFLASGQVMANAQATFSNLQSGSYTLSATYPGDANWNSATYTYLNPINVATATLIPTTTTVTVTPSSVDSEGSVTFTATVQAGPGATQSPPGAVFFFADGVRVAAAVLGFGGLGTTSATAQVVVPSTTLPNGTSQIVASYSGLVGFGPSTSAPASLTVTPTDFRFFAGGNELIVASGKSGTATLNLASVGGSSVSVMLACATSSASFTCGLNPSNPMVNGATTSTLMVNAFTVSNGQILPGAGKPTTRAPAGFIAALVLLFVLSLLTLARRVPPPWRWALGCLAVGLLLFASACGGGGGGSSGPPPPQNIPTPAGTYTVLVTASANGTIHNVKLVVAIQ